MRLRSCVVILRLALLQFGGQRDRGRSPFRKTAMDAAEEDNAALADCIHLNDGVWPGWAFSLRLSLVFTPFIFNVSSRSSLSLPRMPACQTGSPAFAMATD